MDGDYVVTAKSGRKRMQKMIDMEELEKGNIMIAEFMGAEGAPKYNPEVWDIYITGYLDVDSDHEEAQHFYTPSEMKYQTSWDWLMPVVEKCFDEQDKVSDDLSFALNDALLETNINSLYKVVVEFIRNYNNKK